MLKLFLIALLLSLNSCATSLPPWHGKIYQADPKASMDDFGLYKGGLVRRQAKEIINADDPKFAQFMAMTWEDFKSFADTFIFSCKEWDESAPFTPEQIKAFLQSLGGSK